MRLLELIAQAIQQRLEAEVDGVEASTTWRVSE